MNGLLKAQPVPYTTEIDKCIIWASTQSPCKKASTVSCEVWSVMALQCGWQVGYHDMTPSKLYALRCCLRPAKLYFLVGQVRKHMDRMPQHTAHNLRNFPTLLSWNCVAQPWRSAVCWSLLLLMLACSGWFPRWVCMGTYAQTSRQSDAWNTPVTIHHTCQNSCSQVSLPLTELHPLITHVIVAV